MRASSDLGNELAGRGIPHEILHLPSSSHTARLAADALGVPVAHVVKSLLFLADDAGPVLALVPGDATVDVEALAAGCGAGAFRLARSRDVRRLTGYPPGAVPPLALATEIPAVADPRVFAPEVVYCGGGTTTTMLKTRSHDLGTLVEPRRLPIAVRG